MLELGDTLALLLELSDCETLELLVELSDILALLLELSDILTLLLELSDCETLALLLELSDALTLLLELALLLAKNGNESVIITSENDFVLSYISSYHLFGGRQVPPWRRICANKQLSFSYSGREWHCYKLSYIMDTYS